jgi:hypothetical protein
MNPIQPTTYHSYENRESSLNGTPYKNPYIDNPYYNPLQYVDYYNSPPLLTMSTCSNKYCGHKWSDPEVSIKLKKKIKSLDDLIELGNNYHCLKRVWYNNKQGFCNIHSNEKGIDLCKIHNIVESVEKLNNMIGLESVKHTILSQLRYALKYSTIPEKKDSVDEQPINTDPPILHHSAFPEVKMPDFMTRRLNIDKNFKSPISFRTHKSNYAYYPSTTTKPKSDNCTKNNKKLHTVICGPPGTGKTELANIIANIYFKLGILGKNSVVSVKRTDLIGKWLGHTAIKTQEIINSAIGGVLLIDEAYSLGNKEGRDSFAKECIDTLNQNLMLLKDKLICIIVGYEDKLNECFFSQNEGLKSRFDWWHRIEKYNDKELFLILKQKMKNSGWLFVPRIKRKTFCSKRIKDNNVSEKT